MISYVRAAAMSTFIMLTISWLMFAISEFPWIVIADSDFSFARRVEERATAGGELALLSFLAIFWAIAGISVPRALRSGVSVLILAAWLRLGLWLFPSAALWESPVRLIPYLLGIVALLGVLAADLLHVEEPKAGELLLKPNDAV